MIGRRKLLGAAGAALGLAAALPAARAHPAFGIVPPATLRYRNHPLGDKSCVRCVHFVKAESAGGEAHCSVVAGIIEPNGYCVAWQDRNPTNTC